jgi:voltage-gated potassium channel
MSSPATGTHAAGSTYAHLRRRVYEVLYHSRPNDPLTRLDDLVIPVLIAVSVVAMALETVASLEARYGSLFLAVELVSVAVFTMEYLLRLWSAREAGPGARLRFARSPMGIVDLLAIAPFFLPFLGVDLRSLRALRALRLLRLGKLARYSVAMKRISRSLAVAKDELIAVGMLIAMLVLVSSSLIYFAEFDTQPDKFSSIPASFWWGIVTATTVGYGDFYPLTPTGKLLAGINACVGLLLFALATGIMGSAYMEEMAREKGEPCCPHCGKTASAPVEA